MADKLRKYKSLYSSTCNTFSTGEGVTITPASVTGLPTDTEITLTFDRVDSSGTKTPSKMERIRGTVTGGNFVISSGGRAVEGTEQVHTSPVVEMVWNADDWNDTVDWGLVEHGQDGKHTDAIVTSLKATGAEVNTGTEDAKIVTPKAIADSTIAKAPATAAENVAGTDNTKFITALANVPAFNSSLARQAIINGNFDVWQRGTSLALADVTVQFLADRWRDYTSKNGGTLPTLTRTREALTAGDIPNAFYYSRLTTNGSGTSLGVSSEQAYSQQIEHGTRLLCGDGKKVTVSFYARSSIANKRLGISLAQRYGSGGSPTSAEWIITQAPITLTSTWTKYTATFTTNTLAGKTFGTANDDSLQLVFWNMWGTTTGNSLIYPSVTAETFVGSGTIDIAQVQLCAGDVALPFMPESFNDTLIKCMRYYQKSYEYSQAPGADVLPGRVNVLGIADGSGYADGVYKISPMRVSPTVTYYNGTTANQCRYTTSGGASGTIDNPTGPFSSSSQLNVRKDGGITANHVVEFAFQYVAVSEL